jgi:hypothetical protein
VLERLDERRDQIGDRHRFVAHVVHQTLLEPQGFL